MTRSLFSADSQQGYQPTQSTAKAFGDTLLKTVSRNRKSVVLDAHYSRFLSLGQFSRTFPDQYFDFGNSEEHMVDAAVGFSVRGHLPWVCAFAMFLTGKGWDQIRNSVCYPWLNVKLVAAHSGFSAAEEGATYQAFEDIAVLRALPNIKIVCPADAVETRLAVEAMMNDYSPTYLRLSHEQVPMVYDLSHKFELGKGHVYKAGTDVCIFSMGIMLHRALEAAEMLERDGVSAMVVNLSTLAPIDENLIVECAKQAQRVVTVEDHQIIGGLGSAVMEVLSTHYPMKVQRLGMSSYGESGKLEDLYRKYRLDGAGIYEQIREWR